MNQKKTRLESPMGEAPSSLVSNPAAPTTRLLVQS